MDGKISKKLDSNEMGTVRTGLNYEDSYAGFIKSSNDTLEEKRTPDSMAVDVRKQESKIKKWAIDKKKIVMNGKYDVQPNINSELRKKLEGFSQHMTKAYNGDVVEIANNNFRIRKANNVIGEPIAEFADMCVGKFGDNKNILVETADDDRVIGIPYTIANISADKFYVVNGRVYSGWAMWFGLQAIRSPEDYARNVDLTYNVPFIWAGFNLKSQLSLGASFDVTHGSEEEETPEKGKTVMFSMGKLSAKPKELKEEVTTFKKKKKRKR